MNPGNPCGGYSERDLGGGFKLRGVPARPAVGLLSELEALRYLQVRVRVRVRVRLAV